MRITAVQRLGCSRLAEQQQRIRPLLKTYERSECVHRRFLIIAHNKENVKATQQNEKNSCATPWLFALGRKQQRIRPLLKTYERSECVRRRSLIIAYNKENIKATQQNENNSCATPWLLALGRKTIANKTFIKNLRAKRVCTPPLFNNSKQQRKYKSNTTK